jgi:hypothetical protein
MSGSAHETGFSPVFTSIDERQHKLRRCRQYWPTRQEAHELYLAAIAARHPIVRCPPAVLGPSVIAEQLRSLPLYRLCEVASALYVRNVCVKG